jgi:hypothetical protein
MHKDIIESTATKSTSTENGASNRLWQEAAQDMRGEGHKSAHKTCSNGFDNLDQLGEFARGVVVGAADGGIAFLEFAAAPQEHLPKMAKGVQDALGNAANYYSDKLANNKLQDITKDAGDGVKAIGDGLTEYGKKTPLERGKLCGHAAADMMLVEGGVEIAKVVVNAGKAELEAQALAGTASGTSANRFDKFVSTLSERGKDNFSYMHRIPGDEFMQGVEQAIQKLPDSMKELMEKHNIEVVPLKNLGDWLPAMSGREGAFMKLEERPVIFVAEDSHMFADMGLASRKLDLTMRREFARAFDSLAGTPKMTLSEIPAIEEAFSRDFATLGTPLRERLLKRYGNGSVNELRREVVAQLTSRRQIPGVDDKDVLFYHAFKNLDNLLHGAGG